MGPKLARMLIHVSSVVSTTSTSEMPSTPSLYWMPKDGDPVDLLDELEAGAPRVEAQHRDEGQRERDQRGAERRPAHDARTFSPRDEGDDQRADERREDDEREDGNAGQRDHQRVVRKMMLMAITMSPAAMPRA